VARVPHFAKGYKADGPLIGEIWPNGSQWLAGDQMDSNMNYRFRKNITGFVRRWTGATTTTTALTTFLD